MTVRPVDDLVNTLLSRVFGATFLFLVVALGVGLVGVGLVGLVRTRRRHALPT